MGEALERARGRIGSARAEIADQEASRLEQVRRRLRWIFPRGVSEADVGRKLGWPTGAGALLRKLGELGEAREGGGLWFMVETETEQEPAPAAPAEPIGDRIEAALQAHGMRPVELVRLICAHTGRPFRSTEVAISQARRGKRPLAWLPEVLDAVLPKEVVDVADPPPQL